MLQRKSQAGIIFMLVMLFLTGLATIIGQQLQFSAYAARHHLSQKQYHEQLSELEEVVAHIAGYLSARCIVSPRSAALENATWWSQYACVRSGWQFVIEEPLEDNCALMPNKQPVSALYYRITLRSISIPPIFAQAMYLRPIKRQQVCEGGAQIKSVGLQWQIFL